MALSGKFISFQPLVESVYRRTGYQTIDWGEVVEIIGETIKLIGVLPAYKNVTTNGDNNTNPLEISDYRVILPDDFVVLQGIRKVNLVEDSDGNLSISAFSTMTETNDIFYKTIKDKWEDSVPSGTYDYVEFKHVNILTLTGKSGSALIGGPLDETITFSTDLIITASNFVITNYDAYKAEGIIISSENEVITFISEVSGTDFIDVTIENSSGDLSGNVETGTSTDPVQVQSPQYQRPNEYIYTFKIDNSYIYTNFKTGFIELSYTAFVTDDHGFPMIPDDERFINAIKWSIIEQLDYKKWRVGEITDKVYYKSEQERLFYIASAKSKADIPSMTKMEAIKNMFLRSIPKVNSYNDYFKYSNILEKRHI